MQRVSRIIAFLILISAFCSAHEHGISHGFTENKGQWHENVLYRYSKGSSAFFVENKGNTLLMWDPAFAERTHGPKALKASSNDLILKKHAIKQYWVNSQKPSQISQTGESEFYQNFYIGNDPKKWASKVKNFESLTLHELFKNIDIKYYEQNGVLKYDFILHKGANPALIRWTYQGDDGVEIVNKTLRIKTSLGEITEQIPVAYQVIDGERKIVSCHFKKLENNEFGFELSHYNTNAELIIDPALIFATYSGSSADNWGFTAASDDLGNGYSGGIVREFGGYPVTPGAFQINYASDASGCDIGIFKTSANGSTLLYATYLGGTQNEMPHSMVVNANNELYVMGSTGSTDFPVTQYAFQTQFAGGSAYAFTVINFPNGSDLFISRFSPDGTQLYNSTFVGGSGNDGLNTSNILKTNYGDDTRGMIDVDMISGNVYVGSSTTSTNFPVSSLAFQPTYGGGAQDGVIMSFDENLNTMLFGSYLGGSSDDGVYGISRSKNGIYITGGTASSNFASTQGAFQPTFAGNVDGFITYITTNGQQIQASTFIGSTQLDQFFCVDTDQFGNVYAVGQSRASGSTFISGNPVFSQPGGNQILAKFNSNLSNRIWSTAFGNGFGLPDFSIAGFKVDVCRKVYVSGWGGAGFSAGQSSQGVSGLVISPDAYKSTTDGQDFYMMIWNGDDAALEYATYFGGAQSNDHVDGGTSTFDKRGAIYQSVCAACGGFNDFPVTPGVFAPNDNSLNCNNALFKFDFQQPVTVAGFSANPEISVGCIPYTVDFINTSVGASGYSWDFGVPGISTDVSTDENPSYTYTSEGIFLVTLIATSPSSCNLADTSYRLVKVTKSTNDTLNTTEICWQSSKPIGLNPTGNPFQTYVWTPSTGLSDPTVLRPVASPENDQDYLLIITTLNCRDTLTFPVKIRRDTVDAGPDVSICIGSEAVIGFPDTTGNFTYQWSPSDSLSNPISSNPVASPLETTQYVVFRNPTDSIFGCPAVDTLTLFVIEDSPFANFDFSLLPNCDNIQVAFAFTGFGQDSVYWNFGNTQQINVLNPVLNLNYGDSLFVSLIATNDGVCTDTSSKPVIIKSLEEYIQVKPINIFTPDNDGKNDCFSPGLQDEPEPERSIFLPCTQLEVYNRWGQKLFEREFTKDACWDGTDQNGDPMPEGTYYYLFRTTKGKEITGHVLLKRS